LVGPVHQDDVVGHECLLLSLGGTLGLIIETNVAKPQ
jgi:hypothetical protein